MFERYTERARRVIFFARYEAGALGCEYVDTEHLVLGLMREDKLLFANMSVGEREAIRRTCQERFPKSESRATSVDIPLSHESTRALEYAAEEADALQHKDINAGHLLLGLLRTNCTAADLLRQHGFDLATCREIVVRMATYGEGEVLPGSARGRLIDRLNEAFEPELGTPASRAMQPQIEKLKQVQRAMRKNVQAYSKSCGEQQLKRKLWSRKEALGHLVDWGMAYQQWLARGLTQPNLAVDEYPQEDWVSAQKYAEFLWEDLVDLWLGTNRLVLHVLAQVPESKVGLQCRVGIQEPIALSELVERYVEHCEDIVGQILARLE